jgi:hypothetical protein
VDDRPEFVDVFASLDRARLSRMDHDAQSDQLAAREVIRHYVEALWQDVQRSGEHPDVGDKYRALATVRELARSLTVVAFDVNHDSHDNHDNTPATPDGNG